MTEHSRPISKLSRTVALIAKLTASGLFASSLLLAGLASPPSAGAATKGVIRAIGAENEYANVLSQIGGKYVTRLVDSQQPELRSTHLRIQPERR